MSFDDNWKQPLGDTVEHIDSPPQQGQNGHVPHFRSSPDATGYCRIHSRKTYGPNIDVMGWFRIMDWVIRNDSDKGVKLYTAFEDNNANNTISLAKKNGTVAWYVEDREGWYGDHSSDERPWMDGLNHKYVRHRFHWQQRLAPNGVHGRLWINGQVLIDDVDDKPLLTGRVGWRLDAVVCDWDIVIREAQFAV